MIVTKHAIKRYRQRIDSTVSEAEARLVIERAALRCKKADGRTWNGQAMWSVDEPAMHLVTKHDVNARVPVIVTVLARSEETELDQESVVLPPAMEQNIEASKPPTPVRPSKEERRARHVAEQLAIALRKEQRRKVHEALVAEHRRRKLATRRPSPAHIADEARQARDRAHKAAKAKAHGVCGRCRDNPSDLQSSWLDALGVHVCNPCGRQLDLDMRSLGWPGEQPGSTIGHRMDMEMTLTVMIFGTIRAGRYRRLAMCKSCFTWTETERGSRRVLRIG